MLFSPFKSFQPLQLPPFPKGPICYDPEGSFGKDDLKTLFIFVTAGRMIYNFSGIVPMIPLGVGALTAYLKQKGYHNIAIVDQPGWGLSEEELIQELLKQPFDVYGLSTNLFSLSSAVRISDTIKKQINPEATIVIGGPSGAYAPESILTEYPSVDAVHVGEGEDSMWKVIQQCQQKKTLQNIPGLYWRERDKIEYGGKVPYLDLVELPQPSRHLFPLHRYNMHPPLGAYGRVISLETMRGCDYGCNFCSIQRTVRFRKIDQVIDELSILSSQGYREIHFVDPTFSINQDRAALLCEAIIQNFPDLRWTCKNRIDTVNPALLKLMEKAGCYMIAYGVESGDDTILKGLNKNLTTNKIRKNLEATRNAGIRSLTYILIGSPGETKETVKNTVNLLKEQKVDFALFGELMPDTDSPLFKNLIKRGKIPKDAIRDLILHENQDKLFAYTPSGHSRNTLNAWLSEANKSFYGRPSYILQRLFGLASPRDAFNMLSGVWHLVREFNREDIYQI